MKFPCPTCGKTMQCPDNYAGKSATCPNCKMKLTVPVHVPPGEDDLEIVPDRKQEESIDERPPAKRRNYVALAAGVCRMLVWCVVAVWCVTPFLWFGFLFLSNLGQADNLPPRFPDRDFRPPAGNVVMQVMSSAVMIAAFFYGLWCAVGITMGVGFERTVTAAESLVQYVRPT